MPHSLLHLDPLVLEPHDDTCVAVLLPRMLLVRVGHTKVAASWKCWLSIH